MAQGLAFVVVLIQIGCAALCLERGVHPLARHEDELLLDLRIVSQPGEANALARITFQLIERRHGPTHAEIPGAQCKGLATHRAVRQPTNRQDFVVFLGGRRRRVSPA